MRLCLQSIGISKTDVFSLSMPSSNAIRKTHNCRCVAPWTADLAAFVALMLLDGGIFLFGLEPAAPSRANAITPATITPPSRPLAPTITELPFTGATVIGNSHPEMHAPFSEIAIAAPVVEKSKACLAWWFSELKLLPHTYGCEFCIS